MQEPRYKSCVQCGERFGRASNVSQAQWEGRRFCSRGCATRWRAIHEPRPRASGRCPDCGTTVDRLVKGRCLPCYSKARYCGEREHRLAVNRAWRERNPDYFKQFTWRAIEHGRERNFGGLFYAVHERDENTCQHCGHVGMPGRGRDGLHIHHIDGDHSHNVLENLQVLCGSCHAREHFRRGDLIMKPREEAA